MTYRQFYKLYIEPYLSKDDKPFNRQLFNNTKDLLHKDGLITDRQANRWIYPQTKKFE